MREQDWDIHVCSPAKPTAFTDSLRQGTRGTHECSPAYAVSLTISRGRFGGGGLWPDSGVHTLQVRVNHDSFDGVVAQLKPDFVIFDRFLMVHSQPSSIERGSVKCRTVSLIVLARVVQEEQFGWRVRQACPSSICVIDTQDLHFIRRERMKALEQGPSPLLSFQPGVWRVHQQLGTE